MDKKIDEKTIWGMMAEFETPEGLVEATKQARKQGFKKLDAYSPFPIEGLAEIIRDRRTRLPMIVLAGGALGCLGGYFLQYWISAMDYPLNIGGRPLNSWPAFMPVTFETTVLIAAFTAVFAMLAVNGLPQPYHPTFNVSRFELASKDKFFLCLEAEDSKFNLEGTKRFLEGLADCKGVYEVEP